MAIVEIRFGKRHQVLPHELLQDVIKGIQHDPTIKKTPLAPGIHEHTFRIGRKKYEKTIVDVSESGTALYTRESYHGKPSVRDPVTVTEPMPLFKEGAAAAFLMSGGNDEVSVQSLYYFVPDDSLLQKPSSD